MSRALTIVVSSAVLVSTFAVPAAAASSSPQTPAPVWGLSEGWTPFSHWTRDAQGHTTREIYAQPAFTRVGNSWVPTDPAVVPSRAVDHAAEAPHAALPIRFGRTATRLLELGPDSRPVVLSARGLQISDPEVTVTGVTYPDVAASTDLNYRVTATGVKERIVLRSADAPRQFTFHLSDPAGRLSSPQHNADGSVSFPARADLPALHLTAPFATELADEQDGDGVPAGSTGSVTLTIEPAGDGFDVVQTLDPQWLQTHSFPIVIDPSFSIQGPGSTLDCQLNSSPSTVHTPSCGTSALELGSTATGIPLITSSVRRALLRFDLSGFTRPSTVITGAMLQTQLVSVTGTARTGELHEPGQAWTSGATWLTTNGTTPWTSPGGQPATQVLASNDLTGPAPHPVYWASTSLTALVQRWVATPTSNNGLLFKASVETGQGVAGLASSEASTLDDRPKLVISYNSEPDAPADVIATGGDEQLHLSWSVPAANGSPLTGYTVRVRRSSDTGLVSTTPVAASATQATVPGLTNGTSYYAEVTASNALGESLAGTSNPVIPAGRPFLPGSPVASRGDQQASVSWTPAADNGSPLTGYRVEAHRSSDDALVGSTTTAAAGATSATVTGLTNGVPVELTVAAVNSVGTGDPARAAAVTPAGLPFAPAALTATRGDQQIGLAWPAAADNGSPITAYLLHTYRSSDTTLVDTQYLTADARTATVTGLVNGTSYYATVTARNDLGDGPVATSNAVTPARVPDAPTAVTATRADQAASVTWTAPADNGAAITGYTVSAVRNADQTVVATVTTPADASTATVGGLTNGVEYLIRVAASNATGTGAAGYSGPVTPAGLPGAPTSPTAAPLDQGLLVRWDPADPNGDPITGYTVRLYTAADHALVVTLAQGGSTREARLFGLVNGAGYYATVQASNTVGDGTLAQTGTATPTWGPLITLNIDPGLVSTVAGSGTNTTASGIGTQASFRTPGGVVVLNNIAYVATNGAIQRVDLSTNEVTTLTGSGSPGCVDSTNPASVSFNGITDLATDGQYLYTTTNYCSFSLRRTSLATGVTSTLANGFPSYTNGVALGQDGYLYVSSSNQIIKVDRTTGAKTTFITLPTGQTANSIALDTTALFVTVHPSSGADQLIRYLLADSTSTVLATGTGLRALESAGDYLYVTSSSYSGLRRFSKATGAETLVAGTNQVGYLDGSGAQAWFSTIEDLASDGSALYVADGGNNRLRRVVDTDGLGEQQQAVRQTLVLDPGLVSTVAGSGSSATSSGTGNAASFLDPSGVSVVGGFAYVATSRAVQRVNLATGEVITLAGNANGGCNDNVAAASVNFMTTTDATTDGQFLYTSGFCGVRRVSLSTGATSTVANGFPTTVNGITVGADGFLYASSGNQVFKVDPGTGLKSAFVTMTPGQTALSVAADATAIYVTVDLGSSNRQIVRYAVSGGSGTVLATGVGAGALESAGDYLYVTASQGHQLIRVAKSTGAQTPIAGTNAGGYADGVGVRAWFNNIGDIATEGGALLVADLNNYRLRRIVETTAIPHLQPSSARQSLPISPGLVTTVAGSGANARAEGVGTQASFDNPAGVVVVDGIAFIATQHGIQKVELATGQVTNFVGNGSNGGVDSTDPSAVSFPGSGVNDLATDGEFLYTASFGSVRRTSIATGATSTIVSYSQGYVNGVTVGPDGMLYVTHANQLLKIDPDTAVTSTYATFNSGYIASAITSDDYSIFVAVDTTITGGGYGQLLAFDLTNGSSRVLSTNIGAYALESAGDDLYANAGPQYIASANSELLRINKASGAQTLVAGTRAGGYLDGLGAQAWFQRIGDVAFDGSALYVVDQVDNRLRRIAPSAPSGATQPVTARQSVSVVPSLVTTFAGSGANTFTPGTGTQASFPNPAGVVVVNGAAYVGTSWTIQKVDLATGNVSLFVGSAANERNPRDAANPLDARVNDTIDMATDGEFLYAVGFLGVRRISLTTGATSTLAAGLSDYIHGVAVGPDRTLYFTEANSIFKLDPGTGDYTPIITLPSYDKPYAITADADALYVTVDPLSGFNELRRYPFDGSPHTVLAINVGLDALESAGASLYATDTYNNLLIRIPKDGSEGDWIAGLPTDGSFSNAGYADGPGNDALFSGIGDIASDGVNLFVADKNNNRLRLVVGDDYFSPQASALGLDPFAGWFDDVNPGLGNFVTSATDAPVASVGPALAVNRLYNSFDTTVGAFGQGWTFSYAMRWTADSRGNVAITYPDGRREAHAKQADGSFKAPRGFFSKLVADGNGGYVLTSKEHSVYRFDSTGKLTRVEDAYGRALTLSYDASDHLQQAQSASGRKLHFSWANNRISAVSTDPVAAHGGALTWRYYYDADGNLTRACDPRDNSQTGSCTVYDYMLGRLSRVTTPKGTIDVNIAYTPNGKVERRDDGLGHSTQFKSVGDNDVEITDARGNVTKQSYDEDYRLAAETDPDGKVTRYTYDAAGNRKSVTDPNGNATKMTFDSRGNRTSVTDGENHTSYSSYDSSDNLIARRDARSAGATDNTYRTSYSYDGGHAKLTETSPATSDFPSGVIQRWTYTDGTEPAVGGGTSLLGLLASYVDGRGKTTAYTYTAAGDLAQTVDPAGLRTTFGYDELGRRTSQTVLSDSFPNGVTTTFGYDEMGNQVRETDPAVTNPVTGVTHQQRVTSTFDRNNNLRSTLVEDLQGGDASRTTLYDYDSLDRLVDITDAQTGKTLHRTYDENGNPATVTDQLGRRYERSYDAENRPIATWAILGPNDPQTPLVLNQILLSQTSYDPAGRKLTGTDVLGRVTRYSYDHADRLLTSTLLGYHNTDGTRRDVVLQRLGYDAAGNVISRCEGNDLRCTTLTVDAAGRTSSSLLDPSGLARRTSYAYDADGNALSVTLADSSRTEQTRYGYDNTGHVLTEIVENGSTDVVTSYGYDQRGLRTSTVDPRGNAAGATPADYTTTSSYDALGRLTTVTSPQVSVETDGNPATLAQLVRTFGYDTFGNRAQARDPRGNVTVTDYDKIDRVVAVHAPSYTRSDGSTLTPTEQFSYDDVGNLLSHTDRRGFSYCFDYDFFNRLITATDPAASPLGTRGVSHYGYDEAGNVTSRTDQRGAVTTAAYDDLDRPRTLTQLVRQESGPALSFTTTRDYDDLGNLAYSRTPAGEETSAVYDAAGEPTRVTDAAGKLWQAGFDVAGRQTSATDPLGRSTRISYDLAGRATSLDRYDPSATKLTSELRGYDPAGQLTSVTSPRQFVTSYGYDPLGRMTSSSQQVTATSSISTSYGYDSNSNLTRVTNGRGNSTVYRYTPWNQRAATVVPATSAYPNAADRTSSTDYDNGGLPVLDTQPGGVQLSRTFDNLGRLTTETGSGGGTATASRLFGYDLGGALVSVNHPAGTETFSYDDRGLLTQATGPAGASSYRYDADGRLTDRTDPAGDQAFSWTVRSQLQTATDPLTGTTSSISYDDAGQPSTINYTQGSSSSSRTLGWDDLGRLTSDQLKTAGGTVTAATSYGFDLDGNLTSKNVTVAGNPGAGANSYGYDGAGRLTDWTKPDTSAVVYGYDAAGNRTSAGSDSYTYDERNQLLTGPAGSYSWTARGTLASVTPTSGPAVSYSYDGLGRQTSAAGVSYNYDGLDRLAARGSETFGYAGTSAQPSSYGTRRYARTPGGQLFAVSTGSTAALALTDAQGSLTGLFGADGQLGDSTLYDPFGQVTGRTGSTDTGLGYRAAVTDPDNGQAFTGGRWYNASADLYTSAASGAGGYPTLDSPVDPNEYTNLVADPTAMLTPDENASARVEYGGPASTAVTETSFLRGVRKALKAAYAQHALEAAWTPAPVDPDAYAENYADYYASLEAAQQQQQAEQQAQAKKDDCPGWAPKWMCSFSGDFYATGGSVAHAVTHPRETASNVAYAVRHPVQTAKVVVNQIKTEVTGCFGRGDGDACGHLGFSIASTLLTGGASKVKLLAKVRGLRPATALQAVGDAARAMPAKAATAANDAVTALRSGVRGTSRALAGHAKSLDFRDDSGHLDLSAKAGRAPRAAQDAASWVDEGGIVRHGEYPAGKPWYEYQSGAPGSRSNVVTGRPQAPYLEMPDGSGGVIGRKFDGAFANELIDRKTWFIDRPEKYLQIQEQVAIAQHHGYQFVLEMPSQGAVDHARELLGANRSLDGVTLRIGR